MVTDEKTIQAYREKFSEYEQLTSDVTDFRNLNKFIDALPHGALVYDLGAGPGHDALQMQQAGLSVVALEPTEEFANLMERNGITVERQSFSDISAVNRFDGVWASFSLLHAERGVFPELLILIARALKTRGLFTLAMKTGEGEARDKLGRFYTYYQRDELLQLLRDAGFEPGEIINGAAMGLAGEKEPYIIVASRLHTQPTA